LWAAVIVALIAVILWIASIVSAKRGAGPLGRRRAGALRGRRRAGAVRHAQRPGRPRRPGRRRRRRRLPPQRHRLPAGRAGPDPGGDCSRQGAEGELVVQCGARRPTAGATSRERRSTGSSRTGAGVRAAAARGQGYGQQAPGAYGQPGQPGQPGHPGQPGQAGPYGQPGSGRPYGQPPQGPGPRPYGS
jgi:hypothetical protein